MSTTESGPIPVREGDLVAGKYRIEREIGAGGMGVIVAAKHEQLDQRVAIKFIRGETLGNEEGVQRFLREARAAVRLRSEHAARVLDVGTLESGIPFMVMEFLEGHDLGYVLNERGPLPIEVAAEWIAQACEALAEAHAVGIVHRDLKPQNLFLARTVGGADHIKVLDFGVSKSTDALSSGHGALTKTSAILGSPLYMAPEQMRSSRDVDSRADVWALGVVLFELLTRRWPFEAETLPALCLKVVGDPPQSLADLRPDLPEDIVAIVETCLAKNPDERFANAAELASALEPILPPGARILVERARLAISSAISPVPSRTIDAFATPSKAVLRSLQSRRAAPTPSAWGSSSGGSPKRTRTAVFVIGAVLVGVATLGAVGFALHDRVPAGPDEARTSRPPSAAMTAPDPVPSPARLAVVTLASPSAEVAPSAPANPSGPGATPDTLDAGVAALTPPARTAPVWTAPAPAQAKSVGAGAGATAAPAASKSPQYDDIPSLR